MAEDDVLEKVAAFQTKIDDQNRQLALAQAATKQVPRRGTHLEFLESMGAYPNIRPGEHGSSSEAVVQARLAQQLALIKANMDQRRGRVAEKDRYGDDDYYFTLPMWAGISRNHPEESTGWSRDTPGYEVMERKQYALPTTNLGEPSEYSGIGLLGQPTTQGRFSKPARPRDSSIIQFVPSAHPGWPGLGRRPLGALPGEAGPVQHKLFSENFQPELYNKEIMQTVGHEFNHNLGRFMSDTLGPPYAKPIRNRDAFSPSQLYTYSQYEAPDPETAWYGMDEDPPESGPYQYNLPVAGPIRQTPREQYARREEWLKYAATMSELVPRFAEEAYGRMHDTVDPEAYTGSSDEPGTYSLDLQNPGFTNTRVDPGAPEISKEEADLWASDPRGSVKSWKYNDPEGYGDFIKSGWPQDVMRLVP